MNDTDFNDESPGLHLPIPESPCTDPTYELTKKNDEKNMDKLIEEKAQEKLLQYLTDQNNQLKEDRKLKIKEEVSAMNVLKDSNNLLTTYRRYIVRKITLSMIYISYMSFLIEFNLIY